nr:zinc finger, CCHC-type [Tanacetum cinerariifolium]
MLMRCYGELKILFAQQAEQELLQTTRDFHSCRHEEGQLVSSYVLKMKGYIDNLEYLGHPVTLGLGVSLTLIGLRKEYDGFVQNYNMHSMGSTVNELHDMLKLNEQTLPKNNAPALHAIRAGKVQKGHWKRNCPQCLAELLKNKKNAASGAGGSGGEYMSQDFLDHLKDHEIITHRTPPYTSQHNVETAACILNIVPTKKVEKTPYEVRHGKAPKLSYLKVWGCEVLVKRDTLTKPNKLKPISIKCIFIGYPKETMGYSFYYPLENKVLVARNAEFLENSLIKQEASGSLEDLEIIQEEDTHPSIDTSLNHKEDDLEIDEPQSDIVPIRRSTRTRNAPNRMCLYIDAEEDELGDLEMQSMKDNEVWVLVELLPNGKTVGSKWLLKKKTDMDGNEKLKLSKSQGASTLAKLKRMKNVPYASAIGFIMYAVRCTRPNVAFAQNVTSQFQQNPDDIHWTTVKNILKYLKNTKDMFLTGYVFVLNGGVVDWKSGKQSIFATSSVEAEYIAAFNASKEAVWVRKFIFGLGVVLIIDKTIKLYCDKLEQLLKLMNLESRNVLDISVPKFTTFEKLLHMVI